MNGIPPSVARATMRFALTGGAATVITGTALGMRGRLTGGPREAGPAISLVGAGLGLTAVGLMAAQHISPAWAGAVHGNLAGSVLAVMALGTTMLGLTIHGMEQRA